MAARIWVACALVGGCFTSAPPPPISNAATPPATRPVVSSTSESWTGIGIQPDVSSEWAIEMRINRAAPVGTRLGTIDYPTLGCSSDLIRQPDRGAVIVAIEKLRVNPDNACADGGRIEIRDEGETLDWHWFYVDGHEGASSTLRRRSSGD